MSTRSAEGECDGARQTGRMVWPNNNVTKERFRGTNTVTAANPVNLLIRYDFEQAARKPDCLRHTRVRLSAPNVFNDNAAFDLQPVFPSDTRGVFDSIASRPCGRAFTLTIDKKFAAE